MGDVLAAIDIGTNSIHLVVARFSDTGKRFEVVEREREMVRLGSSGGDMRELEPEAVERALAALARFRQVAEVHGARVRAVATSAVREAENRDELIGRARSEAGVEVEVVSGVEEARLIHLGVLHAVPVYDQQLLLVDIGGGSTELLVGKQGEILTARSLKLGAIRLTTRFFDGDLVHPGAVDACRRHIRATLAPVVRDVRRLGFEVAVGSSGTVAALCSMAAARRDQAAPRTYNGFTLAAGELTAAVADITAAPGAKERAKLAGLDSGRADIILAGALILDEVVAALDIDELTYSDFALREGVLADTWRRTHGGSLHHLSDLRRRSVLHLAELMDEDPDHSAQVARLALALFDGLAPRHGLGDAARELLEAAALLSNVGLFISHAQHHKHSYYVIRSTEHLLGFTDREIELIALIARYHRKSEPKAKHPEFAALDADDQHAVACCAAILRIAIGLDRNHASRVRDVRLRDAGDRALVIEVVPDGDADVSLELFAAAQRRDLLESVLDLDVTLEAASEVVRPRA
jgi:exopolyphosphatase/guanosine-5'-triphosphate,3'-diphosphate pyrophosphatase